MSVSSAPATTPSPTPPAAQPDEIPPMAFSHKLANILGIVIPFLAVIAAVWMAWGSWFHTTDLVLLAVGYALTGFGITVGFHRLLTHRSFQTFKPVKWIFAILGSAAVEGPVLSWVSDHRKHHQFSDRHGDPHSPHAGFGSGAWQAMKGLYHAHMGWLFTLNGRADRQKYVPDLLKERGLRVIDRLFPVWVLGSIVLPALIGGLVTQSWKGAATGAIWGGGVRIFLLHHVTFSINSLCHFFGRRPFNTPDESRNVWLISVLTFGESWHNNHHAFPTSAFHGLRRWQLDPGGWVIASLEKAHLAWDVKRIPRERQAAKLA